MYLAVKCRISQRLEHVAHKQPGLRHIEGGEIEPELARKHQQNACGDGAVIVFHLAQVAQQYAEPCGVVLLGEAIAEAQFPQGDAGLEFGCSHEFTILQFASLIFRIFCSYSANPLMPQRTPARPTQLHMEHAHDDRHPHRA